MRMKLESIRKIELYLTGEMSASDAKNFEREMASNPDLKKAVDNQALLIQAIKREALKAEIESINGTGGFSWGSVALIVTSALAIMALIWWIWLPGIHNPPFKEPVPAKTEQGAALFTPIVDSLIEEFSNADSTPDLNSPSGNYEFDGLQTLAEPEVQRFEINVDEGGAIEGKQGIVLIIPPGAFLNASGDMVKGEIDIELIEALRLEDMILYNLTTSSDGKALETGGMFYVNAEQGGEKLEVNPQRPLYFEVPADEVKPGMMAFEGEVNEAGGMNWKNPRPLQRFMTKMNLDDLDFLPPGFEEEVHNTMPFRKHAKADDKLVDSLYYALSTWKDEVPTVTKPTKEKRESDVILEDRKALWTNSLRQSWRGDYTIEGNVMDENRTPISIAKLNIKQGDRAGVVQILDGKFEVQGAKDAKVTVIIKKRGYVAFEKEMIPFKQRGSDNLRILPITLQRKPPGSTSLENTMVITKPDTLGNTDSAAVMTIDCGINPLSIKAIRTHQFQNTFIATTEFEERLKYLHQLENGQELLDLYINNLSKNMYEVDSMIMINGNGNVQKVFKNFYDQKLTNLKDAEVHQDQLSMFYTFKKRAFKEAQAKLQQRYARMSKTELNKLRVELNQLNNAMRESINRISTLDSKPKSSNANTFSGDAEIRQFEQNRKRVKEITRLPVQNPSQRQVYATRWYATGWVNIDRYLKLLVNGTRDLPIVSRTDRDPKIYQWLNNQKTLLRIRMDNGEGVAKFPKAGSSGARLMKNATCFAVAEENGSYFFSENRFDPYSTNKLEIIVSPMSLKEIKTRLALFDKGTSQLIRKLNYMDYQIKEANEKAGQLAKRNKERLDEVTKLKAEEKERLTKIRADQRKTERALIKKERQLKREYGYMKNLKRVAMPCRNDLIVENEMRNSGLEFIRVEPLK